MVSWAVQIPGPIKVHVVTEVHVMNNRVNTVVLLALTAGAIFFQDRFSYAQNSGIEGFAFDRSGGNSSTGFSYFGDGDALAQAIKTDLLGPKIQLVERARLEQHTITPEELSAVGTLKKLQEIQLGVFPDAVTMSQEAVQNLGSLGSIASLSIHADVMQGVTWESLATLQSLEELVIGGELTLSQKDLDAIGKLAQLKHLEINAAIAVNNFGWLANLKLLRSVHIQSDSLNKDVLKAVQELPQLDELMLRRLVNDLENESHPATKGINPQRK